MRLMGSRASERVVGSEGVGERKDDTAIDPKQVIDVAVRPIKVRPTKNGTVPA